MSKTMTVEEFTHASGQDILDDLKEYGDLVLKDDATEKVFVVQCKREPYMPSELREKLDRELAVLNEPGTSEELLDIFHMTPEEMAAAANEAERREKR